MRTSGPFEHVVLELKVSGSSGLAEPVVFCADARRVIFRTCNLLGKPDALTSTLKHALVEWLLLEGRSLEQCAYCSMAWLILRRDEREARTRGSRARCATGAMDEDLWRAWQVVVDHVLHSSHVQTARCNVGRNDNSMRVVLQMVEVFESLALLHLCVQWLRLDAQCMQKQGDSPNTRNRVHEHQSPAAGGITQKEVEVRGFQFGNDAQLEELEPCRKLRSGLLLVNRRGRARWWLRFWLRRESRSRDGRTRR